MSDYIRREDAMAALKDEYNRRRSGYGLRLAWIEKAVNDVPPVKLADEWIPIMDGDGQMPEVDEDGFSDYILISCSNFPMPTIGLYRVDENGGAFHEGDDENPLSTYGLIVNAWMPLPKSYREEDDG